MDIVAGQYQGSGVTAQHTQILVVVPHTSAPPQVQTLLKKCSDSFFKQRLTTVAVTPQASQAHYSTPTVPPHPIIALICNSHSNTRK